MKAVLESTYILFGDSLYYSNEIMITGVGEVKKATDLDFPRVFLGLAGQW